MSDYPEHDKLTEISAETQAAGEFVEWLESKGIHLMRHRSEFGQGMHGWGSPGKDLRSLLAEWPGIDQSKIETEKRQMLASLRAMNEG